MKPRTVLVLSVVVAALAAFIWFVERDLPSSDERAELAGKLLVVEPSEVTGLAAEWQGRSVRLERRGEEGGEGVGPSAAGWWLVEPMSARADSAAVDQLVQALTGLEKKRTLEDADLQEVGLEAPRGTVTLRAGDRTWTLGVGVDVPASNDVLVSLADGEGGEDGPAGVYVTGAGFVDQLGREPGAWRDRDLFPAAQGAVERVTLQAPGQAPVVLERRGARFWIEEPIADLADADRVDDLLAGLTSLRVAQFVDDLPSDGAGLGLSSPRLTIDALLEGTSGEEGGEREPFRLELGAPAGDGGDEPAPATVYGRVGGQTFTATTDLVALGSVSADDWRSPAWTGLRSFEIDGVDVTADGASFSLTRDGIDWQRDGEPLPYGVVGDLLSALTEARGEVVPAASDAEASAADGGSQAALALRITRDEGAPLTLFLEEASGDQPGRLARSSERQTAVRLPDDTVAEVLDAVAAVRDAEPEAEEPAEPAGDE